MRELVREFNLKVYVIGALFLGAAVSTIPASGMISGSIWGSGSYGGFGGFGGFGGGFGLNDKIYEVVVTATKTNECILDPKCYDLDKDLWRSQLEALNAMALNGITSNVDFSQLAVNVQRSKKKTEKQKCEASGGSWTVYAYDPGIRQEACIPHLSPLACNLASATIAGAAQKQIASVCSRHWAISAACGAAGAAYAAWCNDVDFLGGGL